MRANVGDRLVIVASSVGGPVRDGKILRAGEHGEPPYLVQWSDTGHETLFFPGPDAHVDHPQPPATAAQTSATGEAAPSHREVKTWHVDLYLYEQEGDTAAQAVLHTGAAAQSLIGRGDAHRNPRDPDIPEIGDEIAVARALRRLADRLLGVASDDLEAVEGHPIELRS